MEALKENRKRKRTCSKDNGLSEDQIPRKRKYRDLNKKKVRSQVKKTHSKRKVSSLANSYSTPNACAVPSDMSEISTLERKNTYHKESDESNAHVQKSPIPNSSTPLLVQADESEEKWDPMTKDELKFSEFLMPDDLSRSRPRVKSSSQKSDVSGFDVKKTDNSEIGLYSMFEEEEDLKCEPLATSRRSQRRTLSESNTNVTDSRSNTRSNSANSFRRAESIENSFNPFDQWNNGLQSVGPISSAGSTNESGFYSRLDQWNSDLQPIGASTDDAEEPDFYLWPEWMRSSNDGHLSRELFVDRSTEGIIDFSTPAGLESEPQSDLEQDTDTFRDITWESTDKSSDDYSLAQQDNTSFPAVPSDSAEYELKDRWEEWDSLLNLDIPAKIAQDPLENEGDEHFKLKQNFATSPSVSEVKEENEAVDSVSFDPSRHEELESGSLFVNDFHLKYEDEPKSKNYNEKGGILAPLSVKRETLRPTSADVEAGNSDIKWKKLDIMQKVPKKYQSEKFECEISVGANRYSLARLRMMGTTGKFGSWLYSFQLFRSDSKWEERMAAYVEHFSQFPNFSKRCDRSTRRSKVAFLKVQFRDRKQGKMFCQVTRRQQSKEMKKKSPTVRKSNSLVARFCARIADREVLIDLCRSGFTFLYQMFSLSQIQKLGGKFFTLDRVDPKYGPAKLLCVDQLGEFTEDKTDLVVAMIFIRSTEDLSDPRSGWHYISCGAKEEMSLPDCNTMCSREEGWAYLTGKRSGWTVDAVLVEYERELPKKTS